MSSFLLFLCSKGTEYGTKKTILRCFLLDAIKVSGMLLPLKWLQIRLLASWILIPNNQKASVGKTICIAPTAVLLFSTLRVKHSGSCLAVSVEEQKGGFSPAGCKREKRLWRKVSLKWRASGRQVASSPSISTQNALHLQCIYAFQVWRGIFYDSIWKRIFGFFLLAE